jgi:hypothetical protein
MSPAYHYQSDGRRAGPVTEARLRELLAAGHLRPGDLVWREGMPEWVPAARVPELAVTPPGAPATVTMHPGASSGVTPPASFQTLIRNPAVLAGGGCVLTGLLMTCLLGLFLSCGGCFGGGRYPSRLVGEWESSTKLFGMRANCVLELKPDGRFAYRATSPDIQVADKTSGTWKVSGQVEGNYHVQMVLDTEPDRTYGWIIVPVGEDKIRPEGDMFLTSTDGKHLTYTRKK